MLHFSGSRTILSTVYTKEGILLLMHRYPGKLLARSGTRYCIREKNGHSLGKKISSIQKIL